MKKLMALGLASMMLLCGCSGDSKPKTTTCTAKDGATTVFVSEGDKVITQTEQDIYSFADLALTAEDAANKELMDELLANYKDIFVQEGITKGIDITYEVKDEKVIFTIVLDYTKADMKELEDAEIVDDVDSDYISLKATIENFKADGDVCE